ncbi:glycosyltransferase family 28 domain-containing protein [Microdochium trichocladiopsis]|uniref:Glycosyltransferase family 28 domain-containing protein n=1 Tax=Microdochium trichocladiopsis TaxID=1682393 RepID=A0A9P8XV33_9PEZI|nr:glycosyltransferase family 28 domain-containing protein [Microdochium trichocladiopsis]KAH7020720.1 glycosyltransferase family 28 domain-containing protein [Microdochium trichocladiopsis]
MDVEHDPPPPYELISTGPLLSTYTSLTSEGILHIDLTSSNAARLSTLFAHPPGPASMLASLSQQSSAGKSPRGQTTPCPRLNIVIFVVGSRGDVQPFIAYGTALQRYGHRVRLATHGTFDRFVRDSGLEYFDIGGDPTDLMAYMVKNPGLLPSFESMRGGDIRRKRKMMAEMLQGCWNSCILPDAVTSRAFVADVIIANPPSFAHVHCAQALGIPAHIMFTMPWTATRAFPHPLVKMSAEKIEPGVANWLTYGLVELMTWQGLGDVINNWRKKTLELDPVPATMGPSIVSYLRIPHTYCWSPALVAKPGDWGDELDVCGFFLRDEPSYNPPADLADFLAAGPAPLYVGFGSIVLEDPERLHAAILEAAVACGVRLVISRGWSQLGGNSSSNNDIFYLGDCPHEWLFKQVVAVVHHGGAGTTACGLINARPTLIVPFFGDQPFWGNVVASAGAGPPPIPQREVKTQNMTEAIRFLTSRAAADAARGVANKMRQENGVQAAVESLHRHLPLAAMTCDLVPGEVARWSIGKRERRVILSDLAVAVLVTKNLLKLGDLEALRIREFDMDVKRWDPISGGAASTLGVMTDFTASLGGLFIDPYKAYKQASAASGSSTKAAGKATVAVGGGFAKMSGVLVRGTLVDTPLALAEGMRNIPRLYGEEVKDYGKGTDWKSGGVVAAKNFGSGFYHGITGVVVQPWQGAKKEGWVGFLKGAGKGSIGLVTKPGTAMFGLMGYPALGIQKSLMARKGREAAVLGSKGAQVDLLASQMPAFEEAQVRHITERFKQLTK